MKINTLKQLQNDFKIHILITSIQVLNIVPEAKILGLLHLSLYTLTWYVKSKRQVKFLGGKHIDLARSFQWACDGQEKSNAACIDKTYKKYKCHMFL